MTHQKPNWKNKIDHLRDLGAQLVNYERSVINLIASDNAFPKTVSENPVYAGNIVQEGLIGKRPFAGAHLHDVFEKEAANIACNVFEADHANLQPHSCSQANQAVYHALLKPGDIALSLDFQAGGHLTHGLKQNTSGRYFQFVHYGVNEDGFIDYDAAERLAQEHRPKLIICGSSSYPRLFDAQRLRIIADSVGAKLMFDLSHESGLIAGGAIPNIVNVADVTTMSIDKTLRGPFGGIVLCKEELANKIDKAVHPGVQSSFPVRRITDKAHSLALTQLESFQTYATNVLENAKVFENLLPADMLLTGGTDKHYVVLNVTKAFGINGTEAEDRLEKIGILSNRQSIPSDPTRKMIDAGGLRLASAWATSRGYTAEDFVRIAEIINTCLSGTEEQCVLAERVKNMAVQERANDVWSQNYTPY